MKRTKVLTAVCCVLAALACAKQLSPQSAVLSPQHRVLRVCADPNNLPYSNAREEGFENKIAELDWKTALDLEKAGVSWVMQNHWSFGKPGTSSNDGKTHNPGPTTTGTDKDWLDFDAWYDKNVKGTPQDWQAGSGK